MKDGKLRFVFEPGESRLLQTFPGHTPVSRNWRDRIVGHGSLPIQGPWEVEFLDGGPEIPGPATFNTLKSWTESGQAAGQFSGTARYRTSFDAPAGDYLLDLGEVAETCRVTLNDIALGTSFFPPHHFDLACMPKGREGVLKESGNLLEVEVTNLAANRIADLDRRGVNWKAFHEINFVNIDYKPFDASDWPPLPSGLLGPVRLVPLRSH
jgi:hypothetical protein